ncbi:hypothetical protein AgCh_023038 [Apium graveolens]
MMMHLMKTKKVANHFEGERMGTYNPQAKLPSYSHDDAIDKDKKCGKSLRCIKNTDECIDPSALYPSPLSNLKESQKNLFMPKYMPKAQSMETGKNKDEMISLNYPILTRANYTAWAMKMKVYMQAHGVWDAISPKNPKSTTVGDKMDKTTLAAIYQGIPEDVLLSLADKETAKEAWEAIRTLCQGAERVKTARAQTLKAEFESMTMKDSESVDDFSMKLNNLVT